MFHANDGIIVHAKKAVFCSRRIYFYRKKRLFLFQKYFFFTGKRFLYMIIITLFVKKLAKLDRKNFKLKIKWIKMQKLIGIGCRCHGNQQLALLRCHSCKTLDNTRVPQTATASNNASRQSCAGVQCTMFTKCLVKTRGYTRLYNVHVGPSFHRCGAVYQDAVLFLDYKIVDR